MLQAVGTVYVIGSGDCGQLGLGEDVPERLRPGAVPLPDDKKVRRLSRFSPERMTETPGRADCLCAASPALAGDPLSTAGVRGDRGRHAHALPC